MKKSCKADGSTITRVLALGWMNYFANRTPVLYGDVVMSGRSSFDRDGSFSTNCLVRMRTDFECQGSICLFFRNISQIYESKNGVARSPSTVRFFIFPSRSLTCHTSMHAKSRFISKSFMVFFIVLRSFVTDWYLFHDEHFLKTVLRKVQSSFSVSMGRMCEWSWWEGIINKTCILNFGFTKRATVADVTWKRQSSANGNAEGDLTRFAANFG